MVLVSSAMLGFLYGRMSVSSKLTFPSEKTEFRITVFMATWQGTGNPEVVSSSPMCGQKVGSKLNFVRTYCYPTMHFTKE